MRDWLEKFIDSWCAPIFAAGIVVSILNFLATDNPMHLLLTVMNIFLFVTNPYAKQKRREEHAKHELFVYKCVHNIQSHYVP